MKNKVLAMLLALCMVMSLLPVTVFADAALEEDCIKTGEESAQCKVEGEAITHATNCPNAKCSNNDCIKENKAQDATHLNKSQDHVFKCTCTGTGCEGETCCVQDGAAKGTYTAAVKSDNGLCDGCTKAGDGDKKDDEVKKITCACDLEECTATTHKDKDACTAEVSKEGDLCDACKALKAVADAKEAESKKDCSPENPKGSAKCSKDGEHQDECVAKCKYCAQTTGHEGDHTNTECINAEGCAKKLGEGEEHVANCPSYELPKAEEGWDNDIGSKDVKVTIECACSKKDSHDKDGKHDAEDEGKCDGASLERTVTVKFPYKWKTVGDDGKALGEAAIAANKAKAEKDAAETAATATKAKELLTDDQKVCDYCAAANKAADDAATAEDLAKCTKSITCEAKDNHYDDCLSQCTMDAECDNSVGVAAAHRVKYRVIKTTYDCTVTLDKENEVASWKVTKVTARNEQVGVDFDTRAEAEAFANLQTKFEPADTTKKTQVRFGYDVLAVHCPQAKVPDGVVVSIDADGTVAETPAETPEKPTKAEEFTDMEDWMAEGVQYMLDKGWMEGMGDGKFGGRDDLKTTMVLTVLARMNGETITGSTWADDAKAWAEKNAEFFEGIDLTSENMARKDVVLVLWRQAGKPEPSADFELEFTDVEGLEGDHLTAMKWAVENKIVLGNGDGTVSPDGNINRSALSLLTMRADKASSK